MSETAMNSQCDIRVISHDEWMSMNSEVRDKALDITNSIKEAHEKIAKAKELAKDAPNIKGGFLGFGKQKKINEALSMSQVISNEAVNNITELIQQSINFSLSSAKIAKEMHKALAYLAVNGIRDANGRIETLSSECTETINIIIEKAHDFVQQQIDTEGRQIEIIKRIYKLETDQFETIALKKQLEELQSDMIKLKNKSNLVCGLFGMIAIVALILSILWR